jgi:hypothetical protein
MTEPIEERDFQDDDTMAWDEPASDNSWLRGVCMFQGDPLLDDWLKAIVEYRRAVDQDADAP